MHACRSRLIWHMIQVISCSGEHAVSWLIVSAYLWQCDTEYCIPGQATAAYHDTRRRQLCCLILVTVKAKSFRLQCLIPFIVYELLHFLWVGATSLGDIDQKIQWWTKYHNILQYKEDEGSCRRIIFTVFVLFSGVFNSAEAWRQCHIGHDAEGKTAAGTARDNYTNRLH